VATRQHQVHTQFGRSAVQIFAANDRINQVLIESLDPAAWKAKPSGNARTIAAIFTHMHNVRTKWVRLTAPHLKVPPQLNRSHCTPRQARAGLAESAARRAEMLAEALGGGGRVEKFHRDGWARPCPVALLHAFSRSPPSRAGVYAGSSARIPVAEQGGVGDVELEKLWKECGAHGGPGDDS
jgi:DinB family